MEDYASGRRYLVELVVSLGLFCVVDEKVIAIAINVGTISKWSEITCVSQ